MGKNNPDQTESDQTDTKKLTLMDNWFMKYEHKQEGCLHSKLPTGRDQQHSDSNKTDLDQTKEDKASLK